MTTTVRKLCELIFILADEILPGADEEDRVLLIDTLEGILEKVKEEL